MPLDDYRRKRNFRAHARARRRGGTRRRSQLLRAASRGAPPALRLPARARRRAEELGGAEGPEPRSRGEAARGARRGSSARVRRLRGRPSRRASTARARSILWDRGRWEPVGDPHEGYRAASSSSRCTGDKLRGGWTLVRMGGRSRRRRQELAAPEGARRRGAGGHRRGHRGRAPGERRRDRARSAAGAAAPAARGPRRRAAAGGRLAARDQVRRLPRALPHRGRPRAPVRAQRTGLDRALRAGGARLRGAPARRRVARRRGRGPRRRRAVELRGPASGAGGRGPRPAVLRGVRPPVPRTAPICGARCARAAQAAPRRARAARRR